ncbi:MAG TPA: radical SAM protein [Thermoplasmata archaeon]|nr:radical SAM protein [Thermoplasmata archaeon]
MSDGVAKVAPGDAFLVNEIYVSVQGESSLVGTPTIFVRLYACNLRCIWCDSMHAVEGGEYREARVTDLVAEIGRLVGPSGGERRGISHVCWTGGEPLLQWRSVARAIQELPSRFVHTIETDGEVDLAPFDEALAAERALGRVRYIMDIKCPGSGMKAKKAFDNLRLLRPHDEVKFVVLDRRDFDFAKGVVGTSRLPVDTILFSPATLAHQAPQGLDPAILAGWILDERLDVRLQLQVHKYIWPGKERGV